MPAHQDLLARVQHARGRLASSGPATERADADFSTVAIPHADANILRDLLIAEDARVVLEVGLAYGSSALAIAEALVTARTEGARHVIIDAFQDHFQEAGWNALVETGLGDISELVRERSQLALPRLLRDGFAADAAFVDGSHIFHNVFVDLFFVREIVRPGRLIILDDCDKQSVARAVEYFETEFGWMCETIEGDTRLRAYRLPT